MIEKDNGKFRPLGIPTIEDRIVQQCIRQVLEPICEAKFHPHSYGFRSNRSASHAISRVVSLINLSGLHYAVDIDIKSFFDNVSHSKLLKQMWTLGIRDKCLISIISKMLKGEIEGEGIPTKGTPQGGILSPLFSNIVLNELDWWISDQWETFETQKTYQCKGNTAKANASKYRSLKNSSKLKECFIVRYADDFKILCRDYKSAQKMFIAVKDWLEKRLKLEINSEKSKVVNLRKNASEFLGFEFRVKPKGGTKQGYVAQTRVSKKNRKKIYNKIKQNLISMKKHPINLTVGRYNSHILGTQNYFKYATHVAKDFTRIDFLVRKALYNRMRKHWRNDKSPTESMKRLYPNYKGQILTVSKLSLYPVGHISHTNPKNFSQEICNYTELGRSKIHKEQKVANKWVVSNLTRNPVKDEPVQYNDNRIARFIAQHGKCAVTGKVLSIGDIHCHHIIPKHAGGADNYDNLIVVDPNVHRLIHAKTPSIIRSMLESFSFTKTQLDKLNRLRKLVGNDIILVI